jgi:hypothetical protein
VFVQVLFHPVWSVKLVVGASLLLLVEDDPSFICLHLTLLVQICHYLLLVQKLVTQHYH